MSGPAGLADRASRAHRVPGRTATRIEQQIVTLRRERKLGPHRIAALLGLSASTVHAVLTRHGLSRLAWMDRPTGQLIRRYERDRPGELLHVDVKKLGRLRDGGGWRVHGRDSDQSRASQRWNVLRSVCNCRPGTAENRSPSQSTNRTCPDWPCTGCRSR